MYKIVELIAVLVILVGLGLIFAIKLVPGFFTLMSGVLVFGVGRLLKE